VTIWYPHTFGPVANETDLKNRVLLQQIQPTRTGLNSITSKVPVWMSARNHIIAEQNPSYVYRKPWTDDDHWYQFLSEDEKKKYHEAQAQKTIWDMNNGIEANV
jgi:hypothetical protein